MHNKCVDLYGNLNLRHSLGTEKAMFYVKKEEYK